MTGSTRASSRLPHPRYSTASSGPFAPRVSACGRQGSRAFLAVSWLQRPLLPLWSQRTESREVRSLRSCRHSAFLQEELCHQPLGFKALCTWRFRLLFQKWSMWFDLFLKIQSMGSWVGCTTLLTLKWRQPPSQLVLRWCPGITCQWLCLFAQWAHRTALTLTPVSTWKLVCKAGRSYPTWLEQSCGWGDPPSFHRQFAQNLPLWCSVSMRFPCHMHECNDKSGWFFTARLVSPVLLWAFFTKPCVSEGWKDYASRLQLEGGFIRPKVHLFRKDFQAELSETDPVTSVSHPQVCQVATGVISTGD